MAPIDDGIPRLMPKECNFGKRDCDGFEVSRNASSSVAAGLLVPVPRQDAAAAEDPHLELAYAAEPRISRMGTDSKNDCPYSQGSSRIYHQCNPCNSWFVSNASPVLIIETRKME
jgi:hypothetical protein